MVIAAYAGGRLLGYVKSVHYTRGQYKLTTNRSQAKRYRNQTAMIEEIETLAQMDLTGQVVFVQG